MSVGRFVCECLCVGLCVWQETSGQFGFKIEGQTNQLTNCEQSSIHSQVAHWKSMTHDSTHLKTSMQYIHALTKDKCGVYLCLINLINRGKDLRTDERKRNAKDEPRSSRKR